MGASHRFQPLAASVLLAGLALLVVGFRLGRTGLWTDESIYAQTAHEMAQSGDWITPTLCRRPYLIKPPLYHWLAASAFHLFGEDELAARLPQALFGIATILSVGWLATGLFPKKSGWLAGAALLTSPGFTIGARVAGMDMLLLLCITLSLICFFKGYRRRTALRPWFLASGFFAGLGMLAKGPLGVFVPAMVILVFLGLRRDFRVTFSRAALEGGLVALLTASVWYAPVWLRHGQDFTRVFWVGNNLARISEPVSDHAGPLGYYLPVFLIAFLPWSFPFAVALGRASRRVWKEGLRASAPEDLFLLIWFIAPFLFYSAIATKLPGYLLPVFPPAALILSREWDLEEAAARRRAGGPFRLACALGVLALPGVALAVPFLLQYRYEIQPERVWLFPAAAFLTALAAALSVLLPRARFRGMLMVTAAAIFSVGLVQFVVIPVEPYESMKGMTVKLLKRRQAGFPVALAGPHLKGTYFYTGCSVPNPRDLKNLPRPGPGLPLYCLVKDRFRRDLENWASRGRFHLREVRRSGSLALLEVSWE
ncbi:MAG: glycosyltransferase family 39 protein [Acidobacteria bacterium]|nr:glycosyltransferase family 39 protein [Acidobacteriota bacterium]